MAKCCTKLRLGALRHEVTVQAPNATVGAGGSSSDPWANPIKVATLRCMIEPLRGSERFRAMQLESPVTHKITARWRPGITARHRILFGTRVMNIHAVLNIEEANQVMEIMAEEGAAV